MELPHRRSIAGLAVRSVAIRIGSEAEQSGGGTGPRPRFMIETRDLIVGTFTDISAAEAGLWALERVLADHACDTALIARRDDSTEVLYRRSSRGAENDDRVWGLAAGLAVALFPTIWFDRADDVEKVAVEASTAAAAVAKGLSRAALGDLGACIDHAETALVAAAPREARDLVCKAMANAGSLTARRADLDRGGEPLAPTPAAQARRDIQRSRGDRERKPE